MSVTKAIITTAGFGTRFLPITKTLQKEMLPIFDRPLVDYVVEDLIGAGVSDIYFVVSEHNKQIKHFYSENKRLLTYLKKMGKLSLYEKVEHLHDKARFHFVIQPDEEQYGTAVPLKMCEQFLKDEDAFFVFMGDDFMFNPNGESEAKKMLGLFNQGDVAGIATFIEKPDDVLHKYGIAEVEKRSGKTFLKRLVEKPAPGTAPSNLANISKYLLTPEVFRLLRTQKLNPQSGELYITDTVEMLAKEHNVAIHIPSGEYLDCGYPEGWLKATIEVAWANPELRASLTSLFEVLKQRN